MDFLKSIRRILSWYGWRSSSVWYSASFVGSIWTAIYPRGMIFESPFLFDPDLTVHSFAFFFVIRKYQLQHHRRQPNKTSNDMGAPSSVPAPDHHQPSRYSSHRPDEGIENQDRGCNIDHCYQHLRVGTCIRDSGTSSNFEKIRPYQRSLGPMRKVHLFACWWSTELLFHPDC